MDDKVISLNVTINAINVNNGILYDNPTLVASLHKLLSELPPAQSEIIYCKNCGWWKPWHGGLGNCKHPKFGEPLTENYHFCGYGKKKDGDNHERYFS